MPKFSARSLELLKSAHPDLQALANKAIEIMDFVVLETHRDEARQTQAFNSGRSRTPYPQSAHNSVPSRAFDFAPYPVSFSNTKPYYRLIGVLTACAHQLGIQVRFGADFKNFADLGHVELVVDGNEAQNG